MTGEGQISNGPEGVFVQLLGGLALFVGGVRVRLPTCAQRVTAFLALQGSAEPRERIAERLWADAGSPQCLASLRTALWRIRRVSAAMIEADRDTVGLAEAVRVDLRESHDLIERILRADPVDPQTAIGTLARQLLPGWDDEWVRPEQDRTRQLQVSALEALSRRLTVEGRYGYAVLAANSAIQLEPLRESAQKAAIEAHIAERNVAEAHRTYERFRRRLRDDLDVAPSAELRALLA